LRFKKEEREGKKNQKGKGRRGWEMRGGGV